MEYSWDITTIKKHKKYYEHLLRTTKEEENRLSIKEKISDLEEMKQIIIKSDSKLPRRNKIRYADKEKRLPLNIMNDFFYVHPKIEKVMIDSTKCLSDMIDTYDNINLPQNNLNDEELVEIAMDFASWIPDPKYKKAVETYLNKERHLLHFIRTEDKEEIGLTYLFYHPHYIPYFLIKKQNTIEDASTLNHELSHGVFYQSDYHTTPYSNHYYLTELEGSFFDFLSLEYLKEREEKSIIEELEYESVITACNNFLDFYLIDSSIKQYAKTQRISLEGIQKSFLKEGVEYSLNDEILNMTLQENPRNIARYAFSYLTSLDLEMIYNQDREYAFYLLKNIRKNKTENIFGNLRENQITFMDDGYNNWKKKIKTLDKR